MGWLRKFVGGFILLIVLLSLATSFVAYLSVTHQSCARASTGLESTSSSSYSNATLTAAKPYLPVSIATSDLVLAPLANLSLTQGNASAPPDLTDPAFWGEVHASELKTYEEIVPQTVIGFFNSSEEWRAWALQYLPESPSWLDTGFVAQAQSQVSAVDPSNSGNNDSATAVEQGVNDFAASAAGVTLASLDFISFNGLTAMKTLFETNNPTLAACQTLPGQLAQLYESSFDPSVPQAERADYLGRALAITSVMLLVGGKDAFADHFQTAIDGLGLGDSWPAVKPYLGDIASRVSDSASSATFSILQTLAQRFPSDSAFVTGFTADRVDSMVDILEKKGIPDGQIQGDIQQVAQAAGTSPDDQAAGDAADKNSLQQGGGIRVYVRSENKMVRYFDASGNTATIRGTFLQEVIPGFNPRGPNFVQIHYQEAGVTVYHYYPQKIQPDEPFEPADTNWLPTVPEDIASTGDVLTVSFDLLTTNEFIDSIPPIDYLNTGHTGWVSDFSQITKFGSVGSQLGMSVEQGTLEGVSGFQVLGTPMPLTNVGGDTFIQFTVPDVVNSPKTLKITYDGYDSPTLSEKSGSNFGPVTLVSSDGVKLKFVYGSGGGSEAVATVYLQQPSVLWNLGSLNEENLGFAVKGASQTFRIGEVTPVRGLEKEMVNSGSKYDLARVGAEIAYTVCQKDFGVENIQLNEPSQSGADLISTDKTVTIQAGMLGNPSALSPANLEATLNFEMNDLVGQLQKDFAKNSSAQTGYAVLSYLDPVSHTIVTLVAVVPRP